MSKTLSSDQYERHHTDCAHCGEHAWCSAFEVDGGFYYVCHLCYVLRKAVEEECANCSGEGTIQKDECTDCEEE